MPKGFFLRYYQDEELNEMLRKLNALNPRIEPWQRTRAAKEHTDLFGATIQKDEYYFKRQNGPAYKDVIKLSQISMERFLFALFSGNSDLEKLAEQVHEERMKKRHENHRRYSPVSRIRRNLDKD